MNYVVISDLHIGGNTNLDIFRSQTQLSGFLRSLSDGPTTLIINGDFLDFLAVEPAHFDRESAQNKITAIINAEPNQDIWNSFRKFMTGSDHQNRIDILLGNHDVELVFEEVQQALAEVMADAADGNRIRFLIDTVSYPRLVIGGVHFHIEHGFQYDPFNWYEHSKLIEATRFQQDGSSFELPVGSEIVYAVLNRLTPNHPYMPLLKPEAAAFWMLAALAPEEIFRHAGRTAVIGSSTLKSILKKSLKGTQLAPDRAPGPSGLQTQLVEMLLDGLTENTLEDLEEFIDHGQGNERPLKGLTFASSPLLRGKLFLVRRALRSLKTQRDEFFDPTRQDHFKNTLDLLLAQGAKVALFGHSHSRKMQALYRQSSGWSADPLLLAAPSLLYLNTGTWANLLDFDLAVLADDEAAQEWLENLEAGNVPATLIYTYARLEELESGRGARVSLEEWHDGRARVFDSREVLA